MWTDERDPVDAMAGAAGAFDGVTFHLEVEGVTADWGVRSTMLREEVSAPLHGVIGAVVRGDAPEAASLLGKKVVLRIERGDEQRTVRSVVRHTTVSNQLTHSEYALHVVSSMWIMGLGVDSRTYIDTNVPDLVREVVDRVLGDVVQVDTEGLTRSYDVHELIVQYQESPLSFITRWMEQEGIFYFVTEGDDRERLVLCDAMENLPLARAQHDGRVAHRGPMAFGRDAETVFGLTHSEELGATQVTMSAFDWTHPSLRVRQTEVLRGAMDYIAEVHDHDDPITFHAYNGRQYERNTLQQAAQIRSEALTLTRQQWSMRSDVVSAQPGHVLRVEGAPESSLDDSYMIVRCESGGTATEGESGSWSNTLVVVPTSFTYRPMPTTPRPVVPGPETAFVVAPGGQEIHTETHGRVKVRFHWDPLTRAPEEASCWIRVAHNWAGDGFGTFFLPREGMEVVVEFLGGNPDRPLVTGCVYNGEALAHVDLPAQKTQSYIRTKSSQNSDGYNEIRFEDDAGKEFISVHAQKDLRERVLHDHTTHVGNDQKNTVDNDQEVTVHHDRTKTVDNDETITVGHDRSAEIRNDDYLLVKNDAYTTVENNMTVGVFGNYDGHVMGAHSYTIDGGATLTVTGGITQTIQSGGWTMTTTGNVSHTIAGGMITDTSDGMSFSAGANVDLHAAGGMSMSGQRISLTSQTEITYTTPAGTRRLEPDKEEAVILEKHELIVGLQADANTALKLEANNIVIGLTDSKFEYTGLKIDGSKIDIGNHEIRAWLEKIEAKNTGVARIARAALTLIG